MNVWILLLTQTMHSKQIHIMRLKKSVKNFKRRRYNTVDCHNLKFLPLFVYAFDTVTLLF